MHEPIVLASTNTPEISECVRHWGFDRDAGRETQANRDRDSRPYEFGHIVLALRDRAARALTRAPDLRTARAGDGALWVGGTFAAWWRAIDQEQTSPELRSAVAGILAQQTTLLTFGNPRYFGVGPSWIRYPPRPSWGSAEAEVWGGIVDLAWDTPTEAIAVDAGARVLRHGLPLPPDSTRNGDNASNDRNEDLLVTGALLWPIPRDEIGAADRRLLDTYADAYGRVMRQVSNRALAGMVQRSNALVRCVIVADGRVVHALESAAHLPAQRLGARLRVHLFGATTGEAPPST